MNEEKLYGLKARKESDEEYAQIMLDYMESKYKKDFEIVKYIFPEEGFNTDHLQSIVVLLEKTTGLITDVYATLGSPYTYYDHYTSDLASWNNQQLVDCSSINELGSSKLYFYLRDNNINTLDISNENVSRVILLVNITQEPNEETLEKLYDIYKELFALNYEYTFFVAGFTEKNEVFDDYTNAYRVFGGKTWKDYSGKVYATLTAKESNLTFTAFKKLCER